MSDDCMMHMDEMQTRRYNYCNSCFTLHSTYIETVCYRPELSELLKAKLPEYIVQSFMMSGFDDIETILQMDIGEGPNNSIDAIEKFINKKRFPSCMGPHQLVDETFEFPPGHKLKIQKFIRDIQQQHHSPAISEKRKPTTVQPKKAKKRSMMTNHNRMKMLILVP